MGENEPGHSVHRTLVKMEQEMEDSVDQPVVSVSVMVELVSFKVTMEMVCIDL